LQTFLRDLKQLAVEKRNSFKHFMKLDSWRKDVLKTCYNDLRKQQCCVISIGEQTYGDQVKTGHSVV
jgi:hypothetical protein